MTRDDPNLSENLRETQRNIDAMDRTFWRYGVPAILLAWFAIGLGVGTALCGVA